MATERRYQTRVRWAAVAFMLIADLSGLHAQQTSISPGALTPVPRVVWFSGSFHPSDRQPIAAAESVTLAVYSAEQGGDLLWQETQSVVVGADGRYNVLMGSSLADGLPLDLFTTGEPRWLAVRFNRQGEVEQARVHLASVPYALKAVDADTLGGKPASAYQLAEQSESSDSSTGSESSPKSSKDRATPNVTSGTAGFIGQFTDATSLGNSAMFQSGSRIGVGTTAPFDLMHLSFTDAGGTITGLAVQNKSGAANAYSGMLFYDQNGALGQFQGFNNTTHEYRINNIAAGGSINFMIGSASKFLVANTGNVTVAGNMTVNGNIGAKYQDVAEWVETAVPLEAGTVVIVDPAAPNRVVPAPKAYRHARRRRSVATAGAPPRRAERRQGDGGAERPGPGQGRREVWRDQDRRSARDEPDARVRDEVEADEDRRTGAASPRHAARKGARGAAERQGRDSSAADAAVKDGAGGWT